MCGRTDPITGAAIRGSENKDLIVTGIDHPYSPGKQGFEEWFLRFLDGGSQWLAYGRFNRQEQMVVILNNSDKVAKGATGKRYQVTVLRLLAKERYSFTLVQSKYVETCFMLRQ